MFSRSTATDDSCRCRLDLTWRSREGSSGSGMHRCVPHPGLCAASRSRRRIISRLASVLRGLGVGLTLLFSGTCLLAAGTDASTEAWPTQGWPTGTPASVGLDEQILKNFDADLAREKYSLVDSLRVFRCGKEVFARRYAHDYGQIYGKEAAIKG